jgi:hypothetical protein
MIEGLPLMGQTLIFSLGSWLVFEKQQTLRRQPFMKSNLDPLK